MNNQKPILCIDWGTSSFRAALAKPESQKVLKNFQSDQGCKVVFQISQENKIEPFECYTQILQSLLKEAEIQFDEYREIIISGMASSSIGMLELPYATLPFSLDGQHLISKSLEIDKIRKVTLISGVSDEEDIMRGEETQLLGLKDQLDMEESVFILPGTHSKHLRIINSELVGFSTFLTGELFQLLSEQSVVSRSIKKTEWSSIYEPTFTRGVEDAKFNHLLNDLFRIRARDILKKSKDQAENYFYLSGLLIGHELSAMRDSGEKKIFACDRNMRPLYMAASRHLNLRNTTFTDPELLANAYIFGQLTFLQNR